MTREEAKKILEAYIACESKKAHFECSEYNCDDTCPLLYDMGTVGEYNEAINMAIQALEQQPCDERKYKTFTELYFHTDPEMVEKEPCDGVISRQVISDYVGSHIQEINTGYGDLNKHTNEILRMIVDYIESMPPAEPQPKTGHCKECKYFEYDSVAKIDEVPLIVAHEICNKWGRACKTKEDGYCFLFEPQESEE